MKLIEKCKIFKQDQNKQKSLYKSNGFDDMEVGKFAMYMVKLKQIPRSLTSYIWNN